MKRVFKIGKWYKYDDTYCIKVLKIDEHSNNIHGNTICNKTYYDKDFWCMNSYAADNCKELLDLTEIQKYLPDEHIDKFNKIIELW